MKFGREKNSKLTDHPEIQLKKIRFQQPDFVQNKSGEQ